MGVYENLAREELVRKLVAQESLNRGLQAEIDKLREGAFKQGIRGEASVVGKDFLYEKLFENMPLGYVRHRLILNENGKPIDYEYLNVNAAFERVLQKKKEDIIGRCASELGVHNSDKLMAIFYQVAFHEFSTQVDYHVHNLSKVFNTILYSPMEGEFVALFMDVSEVKRTEKFLKDNATRLSLMLEAGSVYPWYADIERGRMEIGNELFDAYGVEKGNFKDDFFNVATVLSRIHPDDRGVFDAVYKNLLEGRQHKIGIEIRLDLLHSGEYRWVDLKGVTQEFDEQGRASKVLGYVTDIQKRRDDEQALIEAKRRAEESDRLKSAFLANVSHEIRTPLNAIVGFSEIIANTESQSEREGYLDIVKGNSNLLLHLINDILDLSRIESGKMEFIDENVSMDELCDELRQVHQMRIKNDVKVVFERPESSLTIISDSHRLRQLYSNLISNAIKYTDRGSITLGYELKGDFVEGYVRDTGSGIPAEKVANVFGRFEKLDVLKQGFGLGLSICKSILDRMGGKIWVESELGVGSCFYFAIPYKGTISVTGELNKPTILVAEDMECNFELVKAMLEDRYSVLRASDGIDVVTKFESNKPDLVLMDVRMPGLDGLTAAGIIRELNPNVPIVATTAFAFETDRKMALAAGCAEYIAKPLDAEKLKTIIERCLENKL